MYSSSVNDLRLSKYSFFIFFFFGFFACKKPYEPDAIKAANNYLVIDGFINTSANGVTTINLSRARSISDSVFDVLPEGNGNVTIESHSGNIYHLQQVSDGQYASQPLNLSSNDTYRLNVTAANGNQYQSDFVAVKQSPPIDSISWKQDIGEGVTIFANTHDPSNNTKYYRWEYVETWQHNARFETILGVNNNLIFYRDTSNYVYMCYTDEKSSSIILGTSVALSQDVINQAPVATIVQNDDKLGIRYSILVRQHALSQEAYQYWEIIQKNTQKIGTLFDLQPSQLHGNITPLTDKDEPVIGFISAGSITEKRIFITHLEIKNWIIAPDKLACDLKNIYQNPTNYLIFEYQDTSYGPYYFTSGGGLNIAKKVCLDCRFQGGTNKKPSFW